MNKKILLPLLILLFLPAIFASFWFLNITGENFNTSNVSEVILKDSKGNEKSFTSEEDRRFFFELKDSLISVEKQDFDSEIYSLYELNYIRVQGDVTYYLCLSADNKNCLAYDANNNWYRIEKSKAQELLLNYQLQDVYKYSEVPLLEVDTGDSKAYISPSSYEWNYLIADGNYTNEQNAENTEVERFDFNVASFNRLDMFFGVSPDWHNVKIYDNQNLIIYDGIFDNPSDFSCSSDSYLRCVVTAEWYDTTNNLYNGNATYEFEFYYDIPASYSISKSELNSGEVLYIHVSNADDETFTASSEFLNKDATSIKHTNGLMTIIPIPMEAQTGEYILKLESSKTSFNIPIKINAKNYGSTDVVLVRSETAKDYESALSTFKDEISSSDNYVLEKCNWAKGCHYPVQKFVDSKEQYWISAPSYGVTQRVNGASVSIPNFGIHYVKSLDAENLPVHAIQDGIVAFSGTTTAFGNTVVIEHGYGLKSVYGHLDALHFSVGQEVKGTDIIASAKPYAYSIASTELFFAIYVNGEFVNPFNFVDEPKSGNHNPISEPIDFILTH